MVPSDTFINNGIISVSIFLVDRNRMAGFNVLLIDVFLSLPPFLNPALDSLLLPPELLSLLGDCGR